MVVCTAIFDPPAGQCSSMVLCDTPHAPQEGMRHGDATRILWVIIPNQENRHGDP